MSEQQIIPINQDMDKSIALYHNASMLKLDEATEQKLIAPFDEALIEIRPDGLIYLPQVFWRQRLNQAFGIGQWCLIVKSQTQDPNKNKLYVEGVLMVRGSYISTAVGEAEYHESNTNQSWASVWESAKSDCITRCCKDMGIAAELWQPSYIKQWVNKYGAKVWVEGDKKPKWRHKDSPRIYKETGYCDDSPNKSGTGKRYTEEPPVPAQGEAIDIEMWKDQIQQCKDTQELKKLFKSNEATVNAHIEIFNLFSARKQELVNNKAA